MHRILSVQSGQDINFGHTQQDNKVQIQDEEEEVIDPNGPKIAQGHYVIAYGPKTLALIQEAINNSFKLFWDGSISMFVETFMSSGNNKEVVKTLLEARRRTQSDEEPPITLLHGLETEKLLRQALLLIKDDETKAFEQKQREALQKAEEDEGEEEEEGMDMDDESEEKLTTFQQDLDMITDFKIFDSTEFTTKVMQGVDLRCMHCFDEHTKPSKHQMQEDLSILEEI